MPAQAIVQTNARSLSAAVAEVAGYEWLGEVCAVAAQPWAYD